MRHDGDLTDGEGLRRLQASPQAALREDPAAAVVTLRATGELGEGVSCSVVTGRALATAGLHPATGGDGSLLCSGDMLYCVVLQTLTATPEFATSAVRQRSR